MNRPSNIPAGPAGGGNRTFLIKRIHVLKRELALDDETYRTVLETIAGKRSCRDIDDEYLNLICQALEGQLRKRMLGKSSHNTNTQLQAKISKLGYLLGWSWPEIARFCERINHKRSTKSCTAVELEKIVLGMTAIINSRLAAGELILSHKDLSEFLRHTQQSSNRQSLNRQSKKEVL
jgi:hypothetical protein